MRNLVDLHAHILPGLDDGPDSLNESLKLLKALEAMGFGHVFATPHHRLYSHEGVGRDTVEDGVKTVSSAAARKGIHVKILPGMEFDLDETLPERSSDLPGGARHLLVDAGFWGVPRDLAGLFHKVMENGASVFLVHPERNADLCRSHQELSVLLESGVRFVGNIGSFSGMYGRSVKRDARELLKRGSYWALASDMHSHEQMPWIKDGLDEVVTLAGRSAAEAMMMTRPMQLVRAMEGDS